MNQPPAEALDDAAIESFLETQSVGTLSLAKADESYGVPVAFTFDPDARDLYFRLGYAPGSRKREFVDSTDRATFVVADETEAGWKSVLARGELEHRSTVESLDTHRSGDDSVSQAERELAIPFYNVFDEPEDMVFALVRLPIDEVTGVAEAGTN
ncbi:pyridoxamine 5'-phosphate oxidase family protein [Halorubrum sp. CBA1229]|jgi:nitroimidazol reductase NimA-like FMN-containing flavoprotein (pyridoxamine 5'-phosphate oxidase superfamily)|uniref:pyridoxamine 5'-phosphate oxidase family protein n=1 Tax=Halorubrum sp. CBA1229 TaxID=1853699 RepID=UPI000F3BA4E1|nr:pyridoxamine 5'-phosphate oxidase family protein [Halorubrum sp. CBA1229]QKY16069.1 pyridoxamine 5'-phosphate oxidase family protein [Halorubrum sp. CBA1229]